MRKSRGSCYISKSLMRSIATILTVIIATLGAIASASEAVDRSAAVRKSVAPAYREMSESSVVVKIFESGNRLTVEDEIGQWCRVRKAGSSSTVGYVKCDALVFGEIAASSTGPSYTPGPTSPKPQQQKAPEQIATYTPPSNRESFRGVRVVMYKTSWCGYCKKAEALLTSLGVSLVQYDIEKDKQRQAEMKSMGGTGVPFIVIGDKRIRGYTESGIMAALRSAR